MSITNEAMTRFWRTMGERYGKRWLDSYGDEPTRAWRDCLNPFTPKDIATAIGMLSANESTREHPPTEPAFRALLQHAVRANSKPAEEPGEFRRGYWRSVIVHSVAQAMGYATRAVEFEQLVVDNKHSLGAAMRNLLDDVDELEGNTGQRTHGQHSMVEERVADIVLAYRALKAAA